MKILKLLGVFIALISVLIGIYALVVILPNSDDVEPIISSNELDTLKKQINNIDLKVQQIVSSDWDSVSYSALSKKIANKKADKKISKRDAENAEQYLNSQFVKKLFSLIKLEFKEEKCSKTKIDYYKKGIDFMNQKMNDSRIDSVYNIYNYYKEISSWVTKTVYTMESRVDVDKSDKYNIIWSPFSGFRRTIQQKRLDYCNNALYQKFLLNISELNNGLKESVVNEKLTRGENYYYDGIRDGIINHYTANKKRIRKERDEKLSEINHTSVSEVKEENEIEQWYEMELGNYFKRLSNVDISYKEQCGSSLLGGKYVLDYKKN